MKWVLREGPFGRTMSVMLDGNDQPVAEIRHFDPMRPFPMFHYQCKRCNDNLSSARPLRSLKTLARRHQITEHQEET